MCLTRYGRSEGASNGPLAAPLPDDRARAGALDCASVAKRATVAAALLPGSRNNALD